MTTDPTIIAEDRAAAEKCAQFATRYATNHQPYPVFPSDADNFEPAFAAIIARHREQREKVLVEALRRLSETPYAVQNNETPTMYARRIARQALKEYDITPAPESSSSSS